MSDEESATTQVAYVKCAVPRCYNYFDGDRQEFMGISYFPFPSEPELRKQWIKAVDLPEETNTFALKICSQHFGNNDIYNLEEGDGKTTAHLKPNAYPSKKLFAFVQNHNKQDQPFDESGKFIGFENPLMDTSQDVSKCGLLTTDVDALPRITSVLSMDENGKMVNSTGNINTPVRLNAESIMYDYEEGNDKTDKHNDVERHAEDLIGEEIVSSDDDGQTPVTNPEKGLQVIPALVKLPPRLPKVDLVGDSIHVEGTASGGSITTNRLPNVDLMNDTDVVNDDEPVTEKSPEEPSTSSMIPNNLLKPDVEHGPIKRRRGRRSKEEMQRCEEDDEWEPSFWGKKALQKDGYASHLDADKRRKQKESLKRQTRSKDSAPDPPLAKSCNVEKNQDDGLEEEDEGWRVVEPIATGYGENKSEEEDDSNNPLALLEVSMVDGETEGKTNLPPVVKRRPGPASKTCRPRYIPQSKGDGDSEVAEDETGRKSKVNQNISTSDNDENNPIDDIYDSSLLVDWSFFKSLIPDLGRLSPEKRMELKSFVLDTLNSAIYDGKPITPILNL